MNAITHKAIRHDHRSLMSLCAAPPPWRWRSLSEARIVIGLASDINACIKRDGGVENVVCRLNDKLIDLLRAPQIMRQGIRDYTFRMYGMIFTIAEEDAGFLIIPSLDIKTLFPVVSTQLRDDVIMTDMQKALLDRYDTLDVDDCTPLPAKYE